MRLVRSNHIIIIIMYYTVISNDDRNLQVYSVIVRDVILKCAIIYYSTRERAQEYSTREGVRDRKCCYIICLENYCGFYPSVTGQRASRLNPLHPVRCTPLIVRT